MIRAVLISLATIAAAVPATAQAGAPAGYHDASGPAAGRSPHRAYRQIVGTNGSCRTVAIHVPAGKLPHYGSHMRADADCAARNEIAATNPARETARD